MFSTPLGRGRLLGSHDCHLAGAAAASMGQLFLKKSAPRDQFTAAGGGDCISGAVHLVPLGPPGGRISGIYAITPNPWENEWAPWAVSEAVKPDATASPASFSTCSHNLQIHHHCKFLCVLAALNRTIFSAPHHAVDGSSGAETTPINRSRRAESIPQGLGDWNVT